MTFSDLRKKDVICTADGRFLGRVTDLVLDPACGQIRALILPGSGGIGCIFHGEKNQISVDWQQIDCIGDDVILISKTVCAKGCR